MSEETFAFRSMNTQIGILLVPSQNTYDTSVIFETIKLLFQQVEAVCSRFLPDSELSKLNSNVKRAESDIPVSPMLYDILSCAYNAYIETQGIFNPGMLEYLDALGYDKSFDKLSNSKDGVVLYSSQIYPGVPYQIDNIRKTVRLSQGIKIDLGGIAKGWTVDRAADYLKQYGAGFVNAGGDIRVFGQHAQPWQIGVEDPFDPEHDLGVLTVSKGAVATSSTWKRKWKKGVNWFNHLIDPRTGRSTQSEILSATVMAPTAKDADVWAKTVLLLGVEQGKKFLQEHNSRAILINQDSQVEIVDNK